MNYRAVEVETPAVKRGRSFCFVVQPLVGLQVQAGESALAFLFHCFEIE